MIGPAALVVLGPLIRIKHHRRHPGLPGSVDVTMHVVPDEQRVLGRDLHPVEGLLKQAQIGLAVAVVTGDGNDVEVVEETDLVQLAPGVGALRIGDQSERVPTP